MSESKVTREMSMEAHEKMEEAQWAYDNLVQEKTGVVPREKGKDMSDSKVTHEMIKEAHAMMVEAQCRYDELVERCIHFVPPQNPDQYGNYDGAGCEICGSDLGWYCPESPDRVCHYFSADGEIVLINGDRCPCPDEADPESESYDYCLFCGSPDERK